jgi:hypothetical protein
MMQVFKAAKAKTKDGWLKLGMKYWEEQRKQKPGDMMIIMLGVNILIPLCVAALGNADTLAPLLDTVKTEWSSSGVLLAGLIGTVIGVLALLLGRGWMALVYGLMGAFIGGSASGISSCAANTGSGISWTAPTP